MADLSAYGGLKPIFLMISKFCAGKFHGQLYFKTICQ